jgi:dolichyl-phosphate beta-glucosyltransferase
MQEVCIVIPCYNEARRLPAGDLLDFLGSSPRADLCLVDDGSIDRTFEALGELQAQEPLRVQVQRLQRNVGKAEAVRAGVLHAASRARFRFIGYWDADLSTPLGEVEGLLEALQRDNRCQLALGSRVKRLGSNAAPFATRSGGSLPSAPAACSASRSTTPSAARRYSAPRRCRRCSRIRS